MSKRARLGARLESWMIDDEVAARWVIRPVAGGPDTAGAMARPLRQVVEDGYPDAAGSAAGEGRSDLES
jgi:hypothetical protein